METLAMVLLTILLVLLLVIITSKLYRQREDLELYVKIRNLIKKPKPDPDAPPDTRMFVAIRRQPAGRLALSSAGLEEYEESKQRIRELLAELLDEWEQITKFTFGFHGSEYGLPSNNEENWMLFASFEAASHDLFRACLASLGQEKYFTLRNQLDIRLLYGEKMANLREHADELF